MFSNPTPRHHRLPRRYDEHLLPSDFLLFERLSLLSDLAVMSECGHPIEFDRQDGECFYHCVGDVVTDHWHPAYCGLHQLEDAEQVDRAVWRQYVRIQPRHRMARRAYHRRSLLLERFVLIKVSISDPRRPVTDWIDIDRFRRLDDRDRAVARYLASRRAEAAAAHRTIKNVQIRP